MLKKPTPTRSWKTWLPIQLMSPQPVPAPFELMNGQMFQQVFDVMSAPDNCTNRYESGAEVTSEVPQGNEQCTLPAGVTPSSIPEGHVLGRWNSDDTSVSVINSQSTDDAIGTASTTQSSTLTPPITVESRKSKGAGKRPRPIEVMFYST